MQRPTGLANNSYVFVISIHIIKLFVLSADYLKEILSYQKKLKHK